MIYTRFLWLLSCLFILSCSPKTAKKIEENKEVSLPKENIDRFPDDWVGNWEGELEIWRGQKIIQKVTANFKISPTSKADEYNWSMVFGDKAVTTKPYLLIAKDKANGLYVIDEQNSIIIESYLFNNKLVSWYVVEGNLILASYEKKGDTIIFEILAGKEKEISITGGTKIEEEKIPAVKTMPVTVMQRAFLKQI